MNKYLVHYMFREEVVYNCLWYADDMDELLRHVSIDYDDNVGVEFRDCDYLIITEFDDDGFFPAVTAGMVETTSYKFELVV